MKVGITGTRQQSDLRQLHRLSVFLEKAAPQIQELHHGDCLGVDAYAHTQAERWEIPIVIHPPTNDRYRAFDRRLSRRSGIPPSALRHVVDGSLRAKARQARAHHLPGWDNLRAAKEIAVALLTSRSARRFT